VSIAASEPSRLGLQAGSAGRSAPSHAAEESTMHVRNVADLTRLRGMFGLDRVELHTARLKHRGLLPLAMRYAIWAVRTGGRVIVHDDGLKDASAPVFQAPFNNVRQWAVKFSARDAELIAFDASGRMEFERTSEVLPPGWSAGVVFSGADSELLSLSRCLEGLLQQPELTPEQGGEIIVCGPPRNMDFLAPYPTVRYLDFSLPDSARFLIGRKKNALMQAMRGPRLAVMHTRIVLQPGALSKVPREFDILAPHTFVLEGSRTSPYLSLGCSDSVWPGAMPRRMGMTMRNLKPGDHWAMHARGGVFVDGGVYLTTRQVIEDCTLSEHLGWEEGEDIDWCARAFMNGWLSDIAIDCRAVSQAGNRLRVRPSLGVATRAAEKTVRAARWVRAAARHQLHTALGRR